jgi:hypothetical protein
MVPRGTLRQTIVADEVDPDAYRKERGRCPRGYKYDGEKCIRTAPKKAKDAPVVDEEGPPKGKGQDEVEGPPEGPSEPQTDESKPTPKPKAPKKAKVKPQGPVEKVTKQNPYGLGAEVREAKTLADLGGHEAITKLLGHLDPSKRPPPDIDPGSITLNLDGDNDSKAMMTWRDTKGRLQAAYTPKFLGRNAAKKWDRVKKLEQKADKAIEKFDELMGDGSKSTKESARCRRRT